MVLKIISSLFEFSNIIISNFVEATFRKKNNYKLLGFTTSRALSFNNHVIIFCNLMLEEN